MKIWLAQLLGIGATLSLFCIYQQSSRKRLLTAKLCADLCWAGHYLCLGGYAGMIPNVIGIFRELVFMRRKESGCASSIFWPILFILCGWGLGALTFGAAYQLLPILASSFVTLSLWLKNPRLTKLISIPVCLAFLIYDCFIGSHVGIFNESLSVLSILLSFYKEKRSPAL